jgi:hypothetical protein
VKLPGCYMSSRHPDPLSPFLGLQRSSHLPAPHSSQLSTTCTHRGTHRHAHTETHRYAHTKTHTDMHTQKHSDIQIYSTRTCTHRHINTNTSPYRCAQIPSDVYTPKHRHIHMHTHTHKHRRAHTETQRDTETHRHTHRPPSGPDTELSPGAPSVQTVLTGHLSSPRRDGQQILPNSCCLHCGFTMPASLHPIPLLPPAVSGVLHLRASPASRDRHLACWAPPVFTACNVRLGPCPLPLS